MNSKKYIGSNFNDFLKEEELLEEAEAIAAKRVFLFQSEQELIKQIDTSINTQERPS